MKTLYIILQALVKARPQFRFTYLTLKCPDFIVNDLFEKPRAKLRETPHWWDNYPEVDSVKYDNNTIE